MYYYKLRVNHGTYAGVTNYSYVYCKFSIETSLENVPKRAVKEGDLLDVFMKQVDEVEKITKEQFCDVCWDD